MCAGDLQAVLHELSRAADLLHQFGRIARYEEMPTPIGPQLDVRKASRGEREQDVP